MNIAQIARMAGVSSAAVSRYFNNGYISESKREAIRKVVEQTGYRPSLQAQTLRTKKTMMIGVIAPRMASYSVGSVVDGLLCTFNESHYGMLLAVTQNNPAKELEYLKTFNDKQVDGVILIGTVITQKHITALENMKVPVVIVGQHLDGYCCVYHDDYHAMYDMTMHMLEGGRTRLGYIGVPHQDEAVGKCRLSAYRDAVKKAGFPECAGAVAVGDFSMESGRERARELMSRNPQINGIVCATDLMAAGAIQYLEECGMMVPEDVAVSGQGDSQTARITGHKMMTIHYSYEKSGQVAAQMLLEILEGVSIPMREVKLGYYLIDPSSEKTAALTGGGQKKD